MKTGDELLALVKELKDSPTAAIIRAAGYVRPAPNGKTRLQRMAFYRALTMAKGLFTPRRPVGRQLTYEGTVITTGAIQIGARYAEKIGLRPGDSFQIEVKRSGIAVTPLQSSRNP
jgi:hypothetical protein